MKGDPTKVKPYVPFRQRARQLKSQSQNFLLVALGVLLAFIVMFAYSTLTRRSALSENQISDLVANAMASATPRPPVAIQVYDQILPSLVQVEAKVLKTGDESEKSYGTGTIITEMGHILTSRHVVKKAIEITVIYFDGTEATASIMVDDEENDIAVLRPNALPSVVIPAVLGSSGALRVGDIAIPVGNPFGIRNSLTQGVISGLNRNFKPSGREQTLRNLIQFDAAINPGNSGGPLLNADGEVVGIVTGLINPTDQNVFIGIGYAVPIETAAGGIGSPIH